MNNQRMLTTIGNQDTLAFEVYIDFVEHVIDGQIWLWGGMSFWIAGQSFGEPEKIRFGVNHSTSVNWAKQMVEKYRSRNHPEFGKLPLYALNEALREWPHAPAALGQQFEIGYLSMGCVPGRVYVVVRDDGWERIVYDNSAKTNDQGMYVVEECLFPPETLLSVLKSYIRWYDQAFESVSGSVN